MATMDKETMRAMIAKRIEARQANVRSAKKSVPFGEDARDEVLGAMIEAIETKLFTIADLANAIDVAESSAWCWVHKRQRPTMEKMAMITTYLEMVGAIQ